MRVCRDCGTPEDLLSRENLCRACRKISAAEYYARNRELIKARTRAWTAAQPERKRTTDAAWYVRNRERKAEYDRQYRAENAARIAARNAAKVDQRRSYTQARRARKHAATVERFTDFEIYARDDFKCYLCGRVVYPALPLFDPLKATLEHRVPLARGGAHSRENCATACWECNARKGTQTDDEFRARPSQLQAGAVA